MYLYIVKAWICVGSVCVCAVHALRTWQPVHVIFVLSRARETKQWNVVVVYNASEYTCYGHAWVYRAHHGIANILLLLSGANKYDITMMSVHTLTWSSPTQCAYSVTWTFIALKRCAYPPVFVKHTHQLWLDECSTQTVRREAAG